MHHSLGNLADALDRDPLALLDGEWVVGWFQFDEGPRGPGSDVERGLERFLTRTWVTGDCRAEPPDEPRAGLTLHVVVEIGVLDEIVPAERHPRAPRERFVVADDGNSQAAADEEPLLIDNAVIRAKVDACGTFLLRYEKVLDWPIPSEARYTEMVLAARRALEAEAITHRVHCALLIVAG